MTDSERIAIAAHLHVLLRRITGRVTDTEWMAANAEYAAAMARFAHAAAVEEKRPELADWATRLELAMGLRTVAAPPPPAPPAASAPPDSGLFAPSQNGLPPRPAGGPDGPRYVGGLR